MIKNNLYPCKPQFYYIKVGLKGSKLYRHFFFAKYWQNPSGVSFSDAFDAKIWKRVILSYANSECPDERAHTCSLIWAFFVRLHIWQIRCGQTKQYVFLVLPFAQLFCEDLKVCYCFSCRPWYRNVP